jgi:hypothetical protein
VDARPGGLGVARERADPAGRLQGAVVLGQAGVPDALAQRRRKLVALEQLTGKAIGAQRRDVAAHVLGLLLRGGHAQQAGPADRVGHPELRRQRVDLLLRLERARVDRSGALGSVALPGVDVERRRPGEQEAAVATAGAAGDRVALEHHRLDPVPRQPARA